MRKIYILLFVLTALFSCKGTKAVDNESISYAVGPKFSADSAYVFCKLQCDFGPRPMNTPAHDKCRDWIVKEFQRLGCSVEQQYADLKGYDGTMLHSTNIIARTGVVSGSSAVKDSTENTIASAKPRILICAHYDTRPWADNDPDSKNHHTPIIAANDAASGVAVMLELARLLQTADSAKYDVDFVCFDAEDYGTPQWFEGESQVEDPWALGAQYWAKQYANSQNSQLEWGILLDMVGGEGAKFFYEGVSLEYAKDYVQRVWSAASQAGYGSFFVCNQGGKITDDHVPVNQVAGIPCIDVIPYYPDCQQSSFGPTWHTVSDNMDHISKETLQAVGQTLVQILYSDN